MWYLYLIENKLGQIYTGISKDVNKRFEEHQSGGPKAAKALKGKAPLTLLFNVQLPSHSQALKAELWVKKQPKTTKQALVSGKQTLPEYFTEDTSVISE